MIKAVLFDLDNVLVAAHEWHYASLNKALNALYHYQIPRHQHEQIFNGLPTKRKLELLIESGALPRDTSIAAVNALKQEFTIEMIEALAKPEWEKVDMMSTLKVNRNILIGCVTNSIRRTAYLMLQKSGLYDFLSFLITNEDVIVAKPDPEGYLYALEKLSEHGIRPCDVLIVEDSDHGIAAATASGANVWRVTSCEEVTKDNLLREMGKYDATG